MSPCCVAHAVVTCLLAGGSRCSVPALNSYAYDDLERIKKDIERSVQAGGKEGRDAGAAGVGVASVDSSRSDAAPAPAAAATTASSTRHAGTKPVSADDRQNKRKAKKVSVPPFVPPLFYKIVPFCQFNVSNCDVLVGSYKLPVMVSASAVTARYSITLPAC